VRTLLFCTSWFDTARRWHDLYGRWLAYYGAVAPPLNFDHLLFIDDASPILPDDSRVAVIHEDEWPESLPPIAIYRHRERLGRGGALIYPGWWRSFLHSVEFARRYGFDKIVHAECDAFVLSGKLAAHLNALDKDWTGLWCPLYSWPETAIQVICKDEFGELAAMRDAGVDALAGQYAELEMPFSNVETQWIGDRYGEYSSSIPQNADFACQVRVDMALPAALR
jgi:hypothetical protein